jgi:hypothetical protein
MFDSADILAAKFAVHMTVAHVLNVLVKYDDGFGQLNIVRRDAQTLAFAPTLVRTKGMQVLPATPSEC